jgi:tetratricopeptide (TPR) repeat protein
MDAAQELNRQAIERYNAGNVAEAIELWQTALAHAPDHWEVMVYLGSALAQSGDPEGAASRYEQALERQPGLAEVHYNLGNIRQNQGRLEEAANCYREAIAAKPDFAYAWYNLGNVLRDTGQLQGAIDCYKQAILQDPGHAPSYNNLGNALKHQGNLDMAIQCYQAALDNDPQYGDARYNLGNAYFEQGDFATALPWFQQAKVRDSAARTLYCLYKCRHFDAFERELDSLLESAPHHSPQVATLVAHHAINFDGENRYCFCPQPFEHVYQASLPELAAEDAPLRQALLEDIDAAGMEERTQGRLHHGVQSSGNLFQRQEASFRQLAELVRGHFRIYRERYGSSDCELIRAFPAELEFESSWYIRMRRGGHLDAHIHEGGWISGVLYLSLPTRGASGEEGCFELGLHGDDYPVQPGVEFPARVLEINVGDIVLFPANLFHRTLPFDEDRERICIAFDLKPLAGVR